MFDLREVGARITELENMLETHFRRNPAKDSYERVNEVIEEHNALGQAANEEIEASAAQLEAQIAELREFEAELDQRQKHLQAQTPDTTDAESVAAHNQLVEQLNALVGDYEEKGQDFIQRQTEHNQRIDELNRMAARRSANIERDKAAAERSATRFESWLRSDGRAEYSAEVNALYADLVERKRAAIAVGDKHDRCIDRLRALRAELGALAVKNEAEKDLGMLVVKAELGDGEQVHLVVDTACSLTCITPQLVQVLDLVTGEPVDLSLPNGIRIKAPSVLIPSVSVDGMTAEAVEGVVLEAG